MRFPVFAALSSLLFGAQAQLLTEWKAVLAHDAATGEIVPTRDGIIAKTENAYTITQKGTLVEQLACGARAFDYRPYLQKDGVVIAHHGSAQVHKPMSESISELTAALSGISDHPLTLLYLSHFDGDAGEAGCKDATLALLAQKGVPVITDCAALSATTVQQQLSRGKLFALVDCMEERYDPKITCYGLTWDCYAGSKGHDKAWGPFQAYVETATAAPAANSLFMVQGKRETTRDIYI